ncbi:MAG: hypothetical protein R3F20_15900 [Planctomycetota bacterium]
MKASGIPPADVLVDHGSEETIKITRETGYMQGFSIYPHTKMSPGRMVKILLEFGVHDIVISSAFATGASATRSRCRRPWR